MNARPTDPTSSEERVTDIVTDTDRISGLDVLEAIREAGWQYPGGPTKWFTDDDIKDQYDRNIGHGDTTRNDLARHRLRWEQQNPPALVRAEEPYAPVSGGRAVLHFRLAREGDQPRPTRLRTLGKAGDRVEDGGRMGTLVNCPTCNGQGLLHQPDVMPEPVAPEGHPGSGLAVRVRSQLAHTLNVVWTADGGELYPEHVITCPYPADEFDKPCRIWASEDDETGESEPGCWVQQCLDAAGPEGLGITILACSTSPWSVYVTGSGYEGPHLVDVRLAEAARQ